MQNVLWYSRHIMTIEQRRAVEQELNTDINIVHLSCRDMNAEQIVEFARDNNIFLLLVVLPDSILSRLLTVKDDNMQVWCCESEIDNGIFIFRNWYEVETFSYRTESLCNSGEDRTYDTVSRYNQRKLRLLWISDRLLTYEQLLLLRKVYGDNLDITRLSSGCTVDISNEYNMNYDIIATNLPLRIFLNRFKIDLSARILLIAEYERSTGDAVIDENTEYRIKYTGWQRVLKYSMNYRRIG